MAHNPDLTAYDAIELRGKYTEIFLPNGYRNVEPPKYATKIPGEPVTFMDYIDSVGGMQQLTMMRPSRTDYVFVLSLSL
jgi:hypothetical protein